jgi:Fe-S-cluster formation regulator IscX/YfhJ
MEVEIKFKHGNQIMFIDAEDYDKIKDLNLTINDTSNPNCLYVKHRVYVNCKYVKTIHIHRLIMGLGDYKDDKRIINHIDGNGLNNCKDNLEICNSMYNSQSFRQPHRNFKSYYFENDPKRRCKWRATLKINGESLSKRFMTEEECKIYIDEKIKNYLNN